MAFRQDGAGQDERLPREMNTPASSGRWAGEVLKGITVSILINVMTVLGWMFLGPWIPAAANVLLALGILGVYGLNDRWALPLGYWAIELIVAFGWIASIGLLGQISAG